jgi:hypothetical protein
LSSAESLRRACHWARIRATPWLAMMASGRALLPSGQKNHGRG